MSVEIKRKLQRLLESARARDVVPSVVIDEQIAKMRLGLATQREKLAGMAAHPDREAIAANTAEVEQALGLFEEAAARFKSKGA